jgi:peptide/nickel transport system substrate-binding protein
MTKGAGIRQVLNVRSRKEGRSLFRAWLQRKYWALISVMAIALISCVSCGPVQLPGQLTGRAAQPPQIISSTLSDPETFNYILNTTAPNVFGFIYDGLVSENPITTELEPALAESWDISDDHLRITFTLREGLRWSDGEPLTADDVVFTYNDLLFNTDIPSSTRDILRIGEEGALPEVRKLDDLRVEFTVPEPFAPFLRTVGLVAVLPKHALQRYVEEVDSSGNPRFVSIWGSDTDPREIIANGPYRLAAYVPSQRVIFERNPYYWRTDDPDDPVPAIRRVIWQIVESTDASVIQFRSGGLDILGISPEAFALLKREEDRGQFTIHEGGPVPSTSFIAFNLNQGSRNGVPLVDPVKSRWFNNVLFRRAVAHAINRQQMINNTYQGLAELQNSPISVQSPYYLSPEEGLPVYDYDPEKSRALLLEAGFQYDPNGQLLDEDGNRVRFTLITNAGNREREAMGAQIRQDLGRIGMRVDFNPIAFGTLVERLANTIDWECYLLGFTGGIEPNSGANVWMPDGRSHRFNQPAQPGQPPIEGRVISDWEERIGELYVEGARTLDEDQRKAIYAESQRITQEYLPFIYLVNPLSLSAVRDRIQNIQYSALGGALWNIYELELLEDE